MKAPLQPFGRSRGTEVTAGSGLTGKGMPWRCYPTANYARHETNSELFAVILWMEDAEILNWTVLQP